MSCTPFHVNSLYCIVKRLTLQSSRPGLIAGLSASGVSLVSDFLEDLATDGTKGSFERFFVTPESEGVCDD